MRDPERVPRERELRRVARRAPARPVRVDDRPLTETAFHPREPDPHPPAQLRRAQAGERRLDVERREEVALVKLTDRLNEHARLGHRVGRDAAAPDAAGEGPMVGADPDPRLARRLVVGVVQAVAPAALRLHGTVVAGAAARLHEREGDPVAGDGGPVDVRVEPRDVDSRLDRSRCGPGRRQPDEPGHGEADHRPEHPPMVPARSRALPGAAATTAGEAAPAAREAPAPPPPEELSGATCDAKPELKAEPLNDPESKPPPKA